MLRQVQDQDGRTVTLFHSESAEFLKLRYADAIQRGDDKTASRLRTWLQVAMLRAAERRQGLRTIR